MPYYFTIILFVPFFLSASFYFYVKGVPVISDLIVNQTSVKIDEQVGDKILEELPKNAIDAKKTLLLQEFFNEIVPNGNTKILVVKAPILNAFALPGNTIVVFDHVLYSVHAYPELAALLAHEYSHIVNRHGMRSLAHEQLRVLITKGLFANSFDQLIKGSNKILTLKKSRGFEKQADLEGLELLRKNKINEQGFVDLLHTIQALEYSKNALPKTNSIFSNYISTHPPTEDRIKYIKRNISSSNNFESNENLEILFKQLTE